MNLPDSMKKVIAKNIETFIEKERVFDSIEDNTLDGFERKQKEMECVNVIMWEMSFSCAITHVPFRARKDFEMGDRVFKKMKMQIDKMRLDKIDGKLS